MAIDGTTNCRACNGTLGEDFRTCPAGRRYCSVCSASAEQALELFPNWEREVVRNYRDIEEDHKRLWLWLENLAHRRAA